MYELKEPNISFPRWKPWSSRPRLSDCFDVPSGFDFAGLYLFAFFPSGEHSSLDEPASHLQSEVIYIGMSKRLIGRTQSHEKITRLYRGRFQDPQCKFLYFAHCEFGHGWFSGDLSHGEYAAVKMAFVQYAERKLIWEYAERFKRLPVLNKK